MGFISGVITGIAVAAGAAAWYMSRSGQSFRDQYQIEQRLGEIGDQFEARSKEIQSSVNTQIAEIRTKADEAIGESGVGERLDDVQASAAEAAAEAESVTKRTRKAGDD